MSITKLKTNLTESKQKFDEYKNQYTPLREKFDAQLKAMEAIFLLENADLIANVQYAELDLTEAEKALRGAVIEEYKATGNKVIDEHCSVRVTQTLKIIDKEKATEWAKINAPILLMIDEKGFKDFAKGKEFDFTETIETVSAVIKKF